MINIQYRLGAFGFLAGDQVASDGELNVGLLDQRLALQWVRCHIAVFGGDPEQIIISGPSAGSGSIAYHITWDGGMSNPPFARAIAEFPYIPQASSRAVQNAQYHALLAAARCAGIDCLRALDVQALVAAQQKAINNAQSDQLGSYGPVIDGNHIRDYLSHELDVGHAVGVPLLVTRDGNEGASFAPQNVGTKSAFNTTVRGLFPNAGQSVYNSIGRLYPRSLPGPYAYSGYQGALNLLIGDNRINCATRWLAESLTTAGAPVYKFIASLPAYETSTHGSYGAFFYSNKPIPDGDRSPEVARARMWLRLYTFFIVGGDPNGLETGTPEREASGFEWPKYGAAQSVLLINETGPWMIRDIDSGPRCDFLRDHVSVFQI